MENKSAVQIIADIRAKKCTVESVVRHYLEKIEENKDMFSFITINEDAISQAQALDRKIEEGYEGGRLLGLPVAVKDNILTEGLRTTCASKALERFIPPYDATVVTRLKEEDAIILGKTNLDEFAMGSSSETSYFGVTKNPYDKTRIPGGSSAGSASSVASGEAPIAIGSDTGGSIRQPAACCGVYGYYPSYGSISRYGVVSMANTLDQLGFLGNSVEDIALMTEVLGGNDPHDATSTPEQTLDLSLDMESPLKGKKVGYPDNLSSMKIDAQVKASFEKGLELLKAQGAEVVPVHFDTLAYALSCYNIIVASEVSSNMSRFDGLLFGNRTEEYENTEDLYIQTRSENFGEEVQRRIAMGTLYLGADSDQRLYKKALRVRKKLQMEYQAFFEEYDFLVTPTTNEIPFKIGEKVDDPLAMYDSDFFTVSVNLSGLCAISIPMQKGLGGSLHLVANRFEDKKLLNAAYALEGGLKHDC